jgi:hypothetical protein
VVDDWIAGVGPGDENKIKLGLRPEEGRYAEILDQEHCEQFQMMRFDVSCSMCESSDEECPWHRQDEIETSLGAEEPITSNAA